MSEDSKLFVLSHKPIAIPEGFELLQVGKGASFSEFRDNTGDNISELNHLYLETTGIYWIWKNIDASIKGQMQYRRWLNIDPNKISNILSYYDIILAEPLWVNVEQQYGQCHIVSDLYQCRTIMSELGYDPTMYDKYIKNGNYLYYSNSFICKKEIYDDLCNFCFSILNRFVEANNFKDYDTLYNHVKQCTWTKNPHPEISDEEYQMRLCGALFERLVTLYVRMNNLKTWEVHYLWKEKN